MHIRFAKETAAPTADHPYAAPINERRIRVAKVMKVVMVLLSAPIPIVRRVDSHYMRLQGKTIFILKFVITAGLLIYVVGKLDWWEFKQILENINAVTYAVAISVLAIAYALNTVRWQILLRGQSLVLRIRSAISIDLVAVFFNSFMPGATGGDAIRVYYASNL